MNTPKISIRTAPCFEGTGRYEVDLDGTPAGWVCRRSATQWTATYLDADRNVRQAGVFRTRREAANEVRIQAPA